MTANGMEPGRRLLWLYAIGVVVFLLAPIVVIIVVSFNKSALFDFPPTEWSLRWYTALITSREWREAFWLSLWLALAVTALSLLLGVPAAYGLARSRFPGHGLVSFFLVSPMVVPVITLAIGFYVMFAPLRLVGRPLGLLLAHTVLALPVVIVIVQAAFRRVDESVERAARACGASFMRTFWHVSLPSVRPALFSAGAFAFLTSFDEVVLALFLGGPQTVTLPKRIWEAVKFELDPSLTAVASLLIALTIVALLIAELGRMRAPRTTRKEE